MGSDKVKLLTKIEAEKDSSWVYAGKFLMLAGALDYKRLSLFDTDAVEKIGVIGLPLEKGVIYCFYETKESVIGINKGFKGATVEKQDIPNHVTGDVHEVYIRYKDEKQGPTRS